MPAKKNAKLAKVQAKVEDKKRSASKTPAKNAPKS